MHASTDSTQSAESLSIDLVKPSCHCCRSSNVPQLNANVGCSRKRSIIFVRFIHPHHARCLHIEFVAVPLEQQPVYSKRNAQCTKRHWIRGDKSNAGRLFSEWWPLQGPDRALTDLRCSFISMLFGETHANCFVTSRDSLQVSCSLFFVTHFDATSCLHCVLFCAMRNCLCVFTRTDDGNSSCWQLNLISVFFYSFNSILQANQRGVTQASDISL